MHIYKMTFVEDTFTLEEKSKYNYDIIEVTDYGTKEISSGSIRHLEDEIMTMETITDDECYTGYKAEDRELIKERIGSDVYDMLLNEELDFIMLIND